MFWAVDTNIDSHGPYVGDMSTQRGPSVAQGEQSEWGSASPYPCPGQTSPLLSLAYCTHTHGPKKEGMPKIASVPPWLPGCLVHSDGDVLVWAQSSTWSPPGPCHTYVVNTITKYPKCSSHFLQSSGSEEKVKTRWNFSSFSVQDVKWPSDQSVLHMLEKT